MRAPVLSRELLVCVYRGHLRALRPVCALRLSSRQPRSWSSPFTPKFSLGHSLSQQQPPQDLFSEKAMAPHSSTLAWKIPWTEEPGRLQSMGSWRVGHNFTFTFHFHALEEEMATHSSVLAWRIPGTGEPGGLPSMGSHRVGHDWSNLAAAAAAGSFLEVELSLPW